MNTIRLTSLVALLCFLLGYNSLFAQKSMDLKEMIISVSGAKAVRSNVFIAVYETRDTFLESELLLRELNVDSRGQASAISLHLKSGMYAVAIFQDLNNNNILDKNMLGIPTEPYGFTNYEGLQLAPPTWNKTSFYLDSDREIVIDLK